MAIINTVTGAIDTKDLGKTLMHEHIMICDWAMRMANKNWIDRDELVKMAVRELQLAKNDGIKTIVDCTTINMGRDIELIHEVASRAEMQIIACTGFYFQEEPWMKGKPESEFVRVMMDDIEEGISGTSIKAGIIKISTDDALGITENNLKIIQAAAKVHHETGLPITTHSSAKTGNCMQQQELFEKAGVDMKRLIIGHVGDSNDANYLSRLADKGCYIGMDRFGDDNFNPLENRIDTLVAMCEKGYASSMILSHDSDVFIDFGEYNWEVKKGMTPENRKPRDRDLRYIDRLVLPEIRRRGVAEELITTMLVDNPRRIFEANTK